MSALRLIAAGASHRGSVRAENEDAMMLHPEGSLWVVADGMGGHTDGHWASHEIIASLSRLSFSGAYEEDIAQIADAIHLANSSIASRAAKQHAVIGSTVVALYVAGTRFAVFWAGDSRVYLLREGTLHRLTHDHTQVQELVDAGALTPEQAERHPAAHVLSRAVGAERTLELEALSDEIRSGDIFLLCSDGLTGIVTEAEIVERLASLPSQTAVARLLELALSQGAPDNVTLVAVACEETTALGSA